MDKVTPARPGNSAASRDIASVLHPYTNLRKHASEGPLVITEGKGIRVFDESLIRNTTTYGIVNCLFGAPCLGRWCITFSCLYRVV